MPARADEEHRKPQLTPRWVGARGDEFLFPGDCNFSLSHGRCFRTKKRKQVEPSSVVSFISLLTESE